MNTIDKVKTNTDERQYLKIAEYGDPDGIEKLYPLEAISPFYLFSQFCISITDRDIIVIPV